jgi:Cu+-exporting ATPase
LIKQAQLTTGRFEISNWQLATGADITGEEFKRIVYSLEKYSNHPLAKTVVHQWKRNDEKR